MPTKRSAFREADFEKSLESALTVRERQSQGPFRQTPQLNPQVPQLGLVKEQILCLMDFLDSAYSRIRTTANLQNLSRVIRESASIEASSSAFVLCFCPIAEFERPFSVLGQCRMTLLD